MDFNYPFITDGAGRTATVHKEAHIRQLIEQVLFTSVEERVNRPTFGTQINRLVFAPNSEELETAITMLINSALEQWLGSLITVLSVKARVDESNLHITVQYRILKSSEGQPIVEQFSRGT